MKVVMFWFDVDDFALHCIMVRAGQPLNSVKPDHHLTIFLFNLETLHTIHKLDDQILASQTPQYQHTTCPPIFHPGGSFRLARHRIFRHPCYGSGLLTLGCKRGEPPSRETAEGTRAQQSLLAIRQAEARKLELELELEHSKVLSAIKQADLESNKDLVAMEETDDQENSDGSEWETDMGSLTLQSTFGTSKATSPTIN